MKIKILYLLALSFLVFSCENSENEFDDFTEQNVYFPIQYPVRTISLLEDSRVDNSIDLQKAFSIGVSLGGLRSNDIDRKVKIALAPELVQNATMGGLPVVIMPSNYYSLASTDITIPKGSFSGTVKVQLTDAFFNDPLAVVTNYVIPLVITESNSTGILKGIAANNVTNPDRRVSSDWESGYLPKDYTMFAVKFINKYHGKYLHKGKDETLSGTTVVSTEEYNAQYIEQNQLTDVLTNGLTTSIVNRLGKNSGDAYKLKLAIDANGNVTISTADGGLVVSGTGKFVTRDDSTAESWGGESRKTLFLDYTYTDNNVVHRCKDTLVFRNDELKFEEFNISVTP